MKTRRFFLTAALMAGLAVASTALTACSNDDNPTPGNSDAPGTGLITMKELSEIKTSDVGWAIGADGKAYSSVWQAMGNHTQTVAVLTYITNTPDKGIQFLAIAYDDMRNDNLGYGHDWDTAIETIKRIDPIAGCQWRMPSVKDWELMLFNNYQGREGIEICDNFWKLQLSANFVEISKAYYSTSDTKIDISGRGAREIVFRYEGDHLTADFNSRYWPYRNNNNSLVRPVLAYNM